MKAYRFVGWQEPPQLLDVPRPEAGAGEVVIRVGGAGACHSDLHVMEYPAGLIPWELPFTLGHETAGWVAEVGSGVDGYAEGDAVAVYGPWGCGRCRACRQGAENYCERAREIPAAGGGLGRDGGMAGYMLVPSARYLVPLGSLDPRDAAALTDAALTPYHAVKRSLPLLVPGATAVVIGVGGLGHMAVQILRALTSARIVAVDAAEDKLTLAREVGADETVLSGDDAAARLLSATGGRGAEVVLDCVGAADTMTLGMQAARAQGHFTLVGLALGSYSFSFFTVPYACSLQTTYWGSVTELAEVIALAQADRIRVHAERFALDDAPSAYERMRAGTLRGRAVITPNG